jgi:hypothetical protein
MLDCQEVQGGRPRLVRLPQSGLSSLRLGISSYIIV